MATDLDARTEADDVSVDRPADDVGSRRRVEARALLLGVDIEQHRRVADERLADAPGQRRALAFCQDQAARYGHPFIASSLQASEALGVSQQAAHQHLSKLEAREWLLRRKAPRWAPRTHGRPARRWVLRLPGRCAWWPNGELACRRPVTGRRLYCDGHGKQAAAKAGR